MDLACSYTNTQERRPERKLSSKKIPSPQRTTVVKDLQLNAGYLSVQPGGRSRYIGSSFWASVDLEGLGIDSLCMELPLFPLNSYGVLDRNGRSGSPNSAPGNNNWNELAMILLTLPQKDTCGELYANFVSSIHPLIPLLHLPSFDEQYSRFWTWYQSWNHTDIPDGVLAETPGFLSLMVSILFAGSLIGPAGEFSMAANPMNLSDLQGKLYQLTSQSLCLVGFPRSPSISSLQAYLIFHSLQIREEEALSSCSFVAVAFRMAQAMGLHRDGTEFDMEPVEVEVRRRLWWYIIHLDVMSSLISGLPLVASLESSTTTMLSEIKDELIGNMDNDMSDSSNLSPSYVLSVGRFETSSVIRKILQTIISPQKYNAAQLGDFIITIKRLAIRTEKRIDKLFLMKCSDYFRTWSANLLRLMVDRAYCLVYFPLLRDESIWSRLRPE
jgi:Fungal specific transcription factor domain